ncbi:hypothetical protein M0811_06642 [Anaeramoeba ignava]|uniref:Knr4/Smi1-like domain-containing protein n=1 Tax=Anaeramoeba ignava TaxID=1746090 RepID=A0A9Q0LQ01_ANAIG|nr:hypothetical protein M0811_06642 [Anaeramoeba ignava]
MNTVEYFLTPIFGLKIILGENLSIEKFEQKIKSLDSTAEWSKDKMIFYFRRELLLQKLELKVCDSYYEDYLSETQGYMLITEPTLIGQNIKLGYTSEDLKEENVGQEKIGDEEKAKVEVVAKRLISLSEKEINPKVEQEKIEKIKNFYEQFFGEKVDEKIQIQWFNLVYVSLVKPELKFGEYSPDFVEWFRKYMENKWKEENKWVEKPLSLQDISEIEEKWKIKFSDEYRDFLQRLHTCSKKEVNYRYIYSEDSDFEYDQNAPDYQQKEEEYHEKHHIPVETHWIIDWKCDDEKVFDPIEQKFQRPRQGLEFDIENNDFWMDSWGECPDDMVDRLEKFWEIFSNAPKLIPVYSHRYAFSQEQTNCKAIISVHQSDIIVYGSNLATYLQNEFCGTNEEISDELMEEVYSVPFWGEIIQNN